MNTPAQTRQNIPILPNPFDKDQQRVNRGVIEAIKSLDSKMRSLSIEARIADLTSRVRKLEDE